MGPKHWDQRKEAYGWRCLVTFTHWYGLFNLLVADQLHVPIFIVMHLEETRRRTSQRQNQTNTGLDYTRLDLDQTRQSGLV